MQFTFQPHAEYLAHRTQIDAAVSRVLASGHYILGPEVEAFETEFADEIGARHCIGVANGTDALSLSLRACGVGTGDTVLTVSHTAVATIAAIELTGAKALLVDIDPRSFTLDPEKLEATLRTHPGVKALVLVHLYGHPADPICVEIARRYGLRVIEDCAQSHGAKFAGRSTGTWADIAAFSFYPTKNLGAIGDGGAVLTNDAVLAEKVRTLRQYGWKQRYISDESGMNSRLDEIQAAILRVKLPHLRCGNKRRREIAALYTNGLAQTCFTPPPVHSQVEHAFHQYVIRTPHRDRFLSNLNTRNTPVAVHYPQPVHTQPAYAGRIAIGAGGMTETERARDEILSLPIHPHLSEDAARHVITALHEFA